MYVCDIGFQKYGMPFVHLLQNMRGRTKTAWELSNDGERESQGWDMEG